MSGPALRHMDSHSLIHEAALGEARELTELLDRSIRKGELEKAAEIAYITVEHWEARTLQHASSEEEGLYVEALGIKPELKEVIISLTRDHQLMREIVGEIKELLAQGKVGMSCLPVFKP
ncbi:hemerythrin domain-containing protein [Paenibacillus larvae]|uniref:hemerythrin domain-containing protein n=1 Tax=Paenibacillus larvae TaxID=1464 RepID=UPI00227ED722|nr:hemerythrin domain-containing protein [Paenibacillus larvae]MCY7476255.1 hemerythrin domain-containing protein [Paenibacillus larvae]MDE5165189.1 hemerythrin domain-containing protein [Paenibacillus larvae subsp. larvae]